MRGKGSAGGMGRPKSIVVLCPRTQGSEPPPSVSPGSQDAVGAGALGTKHVALKERQVAVSRLDKLAVEEPTAASRARGSGLPDDTDGRDMLALAAPGVPARAARSRH